VRLTGTGDKPPALPVDEKPPLGETDRCAQFKPLPSERATLNTQVCNVRKDDGTFFTGEKAPVAARCYVLVLLSSCCLHIT
jgi:hypothetical protein